MKILVDVQNLISLLFAFSKASDKCHGESDCLSFAEHMVVATETWNKHLNETGGIRRPTVVFTTEARDMVEEQKAWNEQFHSPFNFVTNARDLLPDSGFMRHVGAYQNCNFCLLPVLLALVI